MTDATNNEERALVPSDSVQLGAMTVATPHDVIVRATQVASELAKIIKDKKLSKKIGQSEHVFVDAWTTMGGMLGVSPRQIPDLSKIHEDGTCEEWVELVRVSDGSIIGRAKGICSPDEPNWKGKPLYARSSMAATRATSKAFRLSFSWIIVMAGYSPTPAEEMDVVEGEFREPKPTAKPQPWSPTQVDTVMTNTKAGDAEAATKFLDITRLPRDAAPSQIAQFCTRYNAALQDGLSKPDAMEKARKA